LGRDRGDLGDNQDGGTLFQSRIKPTIPIPPDAARYHGITDADVAACPTFAEAWPGLLRALSGRHICAYNADYDMRMLRQSLSAQAGLAAHGITGWTPQAARHHCVMLLFAAFYGDWSMRHGNYRYKKTIFRCRIFRTPALAGARQPGRRTGDPAGAPEAGGAGDMIRPRRDA
jgi:hypothetical protein